MLALLLTLGQLVGFVYFSCQDWHDRHVTTSLFLLWLWLLLWGQAASHYMTAIVVGGTLLLVAHLTHGIGLADILLISVIFACLPFASALVVLLLACVLAISHHLLTHPDTIPFVLDLALAFFPWWLWPGLTLLIS